MTWFVRDVLAQAINLTGPGKEAVAAHVHRILAEHGQTLFYAVISCIGGAIPIQRLGVWEGAGAPVCGRVCASDPLLRRHQLYRRR